jgi:acyl dehydratase
MPRIEIPNIEALRSWLGREVAVSDWLPVTQDRINRFADATGDHQWIHVDPVRAAAESPFGGTIAHGYLTLALIPRLMMEALDVGGGRMIVNYGLDRLRFVTPVRCLDRVRAHFTLAGMEDFPGGVQIHWTVQVEIEGQPKPACIAEILFRQYS